MAVRHGTVSEFDSAIEDWVAYTECIEQYFEANDVVDAAKKRAILLCACRATTFNLIRGLVAPDKPSDRSYAELVSLVQEHYSPKPSVSVQRFEFNSCVRQQGESVADFVAALRRLTEHCEFGDTLNDMLCDRVVCGINDGGIQRHLLAESKLTYKKVLELALSLESADRDARDLQKPSANVAAFVHVLQRPDDAWKRSTSSALSPKPCYRCGGKHASAECRFKEVDCHKCGKKGHIAKVCRSKQQKQPRPKGGASACSHTAHVLVSGEETDNETDGSYTMYKISGQNSESLMVAVYVNQAELRMEVDTGASASVVSEKTYRMVWSDATRPELQPTNAKLRTYSGEELGVLGSLEVSAEYKGQSKTLSLLVAKGNGPSLLGRDWLSELRLDWKGLFHVRTTTTTSLTLDEVLSQNSEVFDSEQGRLKGVEARLYVESDAQPRFYCPRPVPHALRQKVEAEIRRLEKEGVMESVKFSEWAAPIVPVVKSDGSFRICGDFKLTVNQVAKSDSFPLPRIEDLFSTLAGGQAFTKLDLAHAYQQVPLEESSRQYVTVNTTQGLFRYNRLPFGMAAAPAIFQRTMENLLRGVPQVTMYIDDILITGKSEEEHLRYLAEVLQRLKDPGMRLKKSKCCFLLPEVEYLGHRISSEGLHPTEEKVQAVRSAPRPQNVTQLKSFLGLVSYNGKFLPNLASTLAPLYRLLQKRTTWSWGASQEEAFTGAKAQLTSSCLLVHYESQRELVLACDASPYGIGAVLSHKMDDGTEKPVAFASRTLSSRTALCPVGQGGSCHCLWRDQV